MNKQTKEKSENKRFKEVFPTSLGQKGREILLNQSNGTNN